MLAFKGPFTLGVTDWFEASILDKLVGGGGGCHQYLPQANEVCHSVHGGGKRGVHSNRKTGDPKFRGLSVPICNGGGICQNAMGQARQECVSQYAMTVVYARIQWGRRGWVHASYWNASLLEWFTCQSEQYHWQHRIIGDIAQCKRGLNWNEKQCHFHFKTIIN